MISDGKIYKNYHCVHFVLSVFLELNEQNGLCREHIMTWRQGQGLDQSVKTHNNLKNNGKLVEHGITLGQHERAKKIL